MDWQRPEPNRIERGIYRIEKSHINRMFTEPKPIYHVHAGPAFLGAAPSAEAAMALCDKHAQDRASC